VFFNINNWRHKRKISKQSVAFLLFLLFPTILLFAKTQTYATIPLSKWFRLKVTTCTAILTVTNRSCLLLQDRTQGGNWGEPRLCWVPGSQQARAGSLTLFYTIHSRTKVRTLTLIHTVKRKWGSHHCLFYTVHRTAGVLHTITLFYTIHSRQEFAL
jgi:hypothetical protein